MPFTTEPVVRRIVNELIEDKVAPTTYLRNAVASTADNKLTITKSDNTEVIFQPGEGKNWTNIELSVSEMRNIADGIQLTRSINEYDPTNFKNDYFRALVDNTGESVGEGIGTLENFSKVLVDIKNFKTSEGVKKTISPDWYSATFEKILII